MKTVIISGRPIALQERNKAQLKGITIGDSLSYRFFDGSFHGVPMLFAEPKGGIAPPRSLAATASGISAKFNLPVVFLLSACPAYERQRLIDKEVFFVVSDKYANLPMLVANERIRRTKQSKRLNPVGQYLLFYHLQEESLEGLAARDIEGKVPYSYASITLGITCLADVGLCQKITDGSKRKAIHFTNVGMQLWSQAKPFIINPVERRIYCDEFHSEEQFPICGINALAHYTKLNPDPERMIMMGSVRLHSYMESGALIQPNDYDGNIIIEAWKYPPVHKIDSKIEWVDRLSLAVSLSGDSDARVEGEVERLINETEWKA